MNISGFLKTRVTLVRLFGALVALYVILRWIFPSEDMAALTGITLTIVGTLLCFRWFRPFLRQSIWRLRNRLIVTWMFIGVVPIVLILTLAAIGGWIVVGQMAVYLVSSELERGAESLADPVRILSQTRPGDRAGMARQMGDFLAGHMPGFEMVASGADNGTVHYPAGSAMAAPAEGWKDYTGIIARDGVYYSASVARTGGTVAAGLAPLTPEVLEKAVPGIGALSIITTRGGDIGLKSRAGTVPPAFPGLEWLDLRVSWVNSIRYTDWENPSAGGTAYLSIQTRPSAVLGAVFRNGFEFGQMALILFAVVASTLLGVWLVSIVIGLSLTRSITGAVHKLYEGTLRIGMGDFSWRIPVEGKDQLAELGRSFNDMTAQIEKLVGIAREKERLESEVEIARDVQNQLFPRAAPGMQTIELVGVCQPARMVSGDYYDYLRLPDGNLALAIGDVAGKGISAALLMASIQSIVRTQLASGMPLAAASASAHSSTSSIVAQLNRQLYASTAPEKYATFFFGAYDDHSRILTYTNAGHVQPLLLRGSEVIPLEVTGTVVGAFPSIGYEEQTAEIRPDDLLIAYTDGITEPENAYGEEFGAGRLAETALRHRDSEPKEIVAKIMEAVRQWSTAPELPDDMTVVIARGLA